MSLWQMPSGILRRYAPNADLLSAEAEASGCRMTTASRTRSRVLRNWQARFWSGSRGSDPPADRNTRPKHAGLLPESNGSDSAEQRPSGQHRRAWGRVKALVSCRSPLDKQIRLVAHSQIRMPRLASGVICSGSTISGSSISSVVGSFARTWDEETDSV